MARITRLEIEVALFPLLKRNFQFKRLILVEPEILLETDRSGRSNLEFQPSEKPKAGEKKAEGGEKFPALVFDEVRMEKGLLTYKDGKGGRPTR